MGFNGKNIITYMSKRLDKDVRIEDLCNRFRLNRVELISNFKHEFGITPIRFFWYFKTVVTSDLISQFEDVKIHRIVAFMNYKSHDHFCKKTKGVLGAKPRELKSESGIQKLNDAMNRVIFAEKSLLNLLEENEIILHQTIEMYQLRCQKTIKYKAVV